VVHLHGGHTETESDGLPEAWFTQGFKETGPFFAKKIYHYDNDQEAATLWYHDHALGITRLNVYAGLAGFYFVRDLFDTGISSNKKKGGNPLGLPAWPYEKAYAIQDRMFRDTGELFYPAFPGDPFYAGFIDDEGAVLPTDLFPGGGPTGLAEFFGDHMIVNGVIWPKEDVEPRNYRMHLLNGTDSRFMGIRFRQVPAGATSLGESTPLPFHVIGSDQGLSPEAIQTTLLVFEPGSRYDIVVDFGQVAFGDRVIMENIGGDAPFGGDLFDPLTMTQEEIDAAVEEGDLFPDRQTDRVMAFDVVLPLDTKDADTWSVAGFEDSTRNESRSRAPTNVRKVALFEGVDEFGRLQPLLGTVDGDSGAGFSDAYTWFQGTTETPMLGADEDWEIYNFTGDAHPIHLHLVNFETIGRNALMADEIGMVGTTQHNGTSGMVASFSNVAKGADISASIGPAQGYVETTRKDMVTALPEQVTTIRVSPFDKTGRYVWHCHILSHEDHEMMRVLEVV
jgi:FtsP/CotA-like multicopper oxidase with cupredoxin domain